VVAVLAQPDALPRAQGELAVRYRDAEGRAEEAGLHVRRLKNNEPRLGLQDRSGGIILGSWLLAPPPPHTHTPTLLAFTASLKAQLPLRNHDVYFGFLSGPASLSLAPLYSLD
jgi:hypothetical protein